MTDRYPPRFGDEVVDYEWDWSSRLEDGESLVGEPVVTIAGAADATVTSISTTGTVTRFWISGGGTAAKRARVNLLATTDSVPARKLGEQISLQIKPR